MSRRRINDLYLGSLKRKNDAEAEQMRKQEAQKWEKSLNATHKLIYSNNNRYSVNLLPSMQATISPFSTRCMPPCRLRSSRDPQIRKSKSVVATDVYSKAIKEIMADKGTDDPVFRSMNSLPPIVPDETYKDIKPFNPLSSTINHLQHLCII